MGERTNIEIKQERSETPLYVYLHWASPDAAREALADALGHEDAVARWGGESYLTRTIVREITRTWGAKETGMGLCVGEPDDGTIVARVDCAKQTVDGVPFADWLKGGK